MADQKSAVRRGSPKAALLFELENVGFGGRKVAYDVLKSLLADKDIALTPALFSRYCVHAPIDKGLPHLLKAVDRGRIAPEKLIPDIVDGIRLSLADSTPKPHASLSKIVKKAAESGIAVGGVSDLDADAAEMLLKALPIDAEHAAVVNAVAGERRTTDPSAWAGVGRALQATLPSCVAIVSSADACRAALAAGMRCVVVPDTFTSFQDFSGADLVIDAWDGEAADSVVAMLSAAS